MKTNITLSIDADLKQKALPIIQNRWHSSLSAEFQEFLIKKIKEAGSQPTGSNDKRE